MLTIETKMAKAIVSFILIISAAVLTSCGLDTSATNSNSVVAVETDSTEGSAESSIPSGEKSDVNACSSVKIAFDDLFAMSESGQYSPDELNQQRILAYESGLLSVESERLYYLMDFLRSWNMNPVGLSVNEYREMQSICESLGVSF
jgi:hypothetical protein